MSEGGTDRGNRVRPSDPALGSAEDPLQRLRDGLARRRGWLFAGLAALYLASFTGQWRIGEDSALYLTLARSLAEGEGYRFGGEWHRFGFPGLPRLLSPLYRLFGEAAPDAATWLMLPLAGLTLAGVYRLFRLHAGTGVATAMVLGLGVCENFYRYAFQVRNDVPYLLGIVAVLAGYEGLRRGREEGGRPAVDWAMVAGGMALLTCMRPVMLVFHAAVLAACAWGVARGPKRVMHAVLAALSVATMVVFFVADPRRETAPAPSPAPAAVVANVDNAGPSNAVETPAAGEDQAAPRYESKLFDKLERLPDTLSRGLGHWAKLTWGGLLSEAVLGIELGLGVLDAAFAAALLIAGLLLAKKRPLWGLFVAANVGQMLLFPPIERYVLPMIPLLLYAGWELLRWASHRLREDQAKWLVAGVVILAVGPNLGLDVALIAEQRAADTYARQGGGRFARVPAMVDAVEAHVPPGAVLISDEVRVLTLLTRRTGCTSGEAMRDWRAGEGEGDGEGQGEDARWHPPHGEVWAALRIPPTAAQRSLLEQAGVRVIGEAAVVEPDADAARDAADAGEKLPTRERGWRLVRLAFE